MSKKTLANMMVNLVSQPKSGDVMLSSAKMMLSLVPFWLILMVASPVVNSNPLSLKFATRAARENRHEEGSSNDFGRDFSILGDSLQERQRRSVRMVVRDLKARSSDDGPRVNVHPSSANNLPTYFDPKIIYHEFIYNKRKKRELREPRKISTSTASSSNMSGYYPFLMAEMIPDSVKTRHPSIIAVTGCPAYYIADHKGQCRQVFQYTVNFGQRSPKSHEPTTTEPPHKFSHKVYDHSSGDDHGADMPRRPSPKFNPRQVNFFKPTRAPPPSRILSLLRDAAKKFDLSFLKNKNSSSSGEIKHDEGVDKLRRKILKALKITKDKNSSKHDSKKSDKKKSMKDIKSATTPDYDD